MSISVVKKVFIASSGVSTIGCPATLNEVFNTIGKPLIPFNSNNNACRNGS